MQINCWHTSIHLVKRVLAAPCREDVDALNAQQLRELPGEARRFVAQDAGSPEVLAAACPARRTLDLKVRKGRQGCGGLGGLLPPGAAEEGQHAHRGTSPVLAQLELSQYG